MAGTITWWDWGRGMRPESPSERSASCAGRTKSVSARRSTLWSLGCAGRGFPFATFDHLYEAHDDFESVYRAIAESLLREAASGVSLVYAVPGHPMVAERSVRLLLAEGPDRGVRIDVKGAAASSTRPLPAWASIRWRVSPCWTGPPWRLPGSIRAFI